MIPLSHNPVSVHLGGTPCDSLHPITFHPILNKPRSSASLFWNCKRRRKRKSSITMASNLRTNNFLRHVESMKLLPSGAGHISHLNAVILGESLATEEDDFVLPSEDFASQANVQSPEQVSEYLHWSVLKFWIWLQLHECFLGFNDFGFLTYEEKGASVFVQDSVKKKKIIFLSFSYVFVYDCDLSVSEDV